VIMFLHSFREEAQWVRGSFYISELVDYLFYREARPRVSQSKPAQSLVVPVSSFSWYDTLLY
jgi:hypothetical protein